MEVEGKGGTPEGHRHHAAEIRRGMDRTANSEAPIFKRKQKVKDQSKHQKF